MTTLEQMAQKGAEDFTANKLFLAMGVPFYKRVLGISSKPMNLETLGYNFFNKNNEYNLSVAHRVVEIIIPEYFGKELNGCFGNKYKLCVEKNTKDTKGDLHQLVAVKK